MLKEKTPFSTQVIKCFELNQFNLNCISPIKKNMNPRVPSPILITLKRKDPIITVEGMFKIKKGNFINLNIRTMKTLKYTRRRRKYSKRYYFLGTLYL